MMYTATGVPLGGHMKKQQSILNKANSQDMIKPSLRWGYEDGETAAGPTELSGLLDVGGKGDRDNQATREASGRGDRVETITWYSSNVGWDGRSEPSLARGMEEDVRVRKHRTVICISVLTALTSRTWALLPCQGYHRENTILMAMTVIMTMTFFLESGLSFRYTSLKIDVWGICWIIKVEMLND